MVYSAVRTTETIAFFMNSFRILQPVEHDLWQNIFSRCVTKYCESVFGFNDTLSSSICSNSRVIESPSRPQLRVWDTETSNGENGISQSILSRCNSFEGTFQNEKGHSRKATNQKYFAFIISMLLYKNNNDFYIHLMFASQQFHSTM